MTELPPPPSASNDMRATRGQQQQSDGIFVPMQQLQGLAKMWVNFRPIIGFAARMAKMKIPPELDQGLEAIAATGNPAMLKELAERDQMNQGGMPSGQWMPPGMGQEVPDNEPGSPVMTHDLAEEAYYLHTQKGWGVRQIAEDFTNRGNPVSKATVARYIDDVQEEINEEKGQRRHTVARGGLVLFAWVGSAFGLALVLHLLRVL